MILLTDRAGSSHPLIDTLRAVPRVSVLVREKDLPASEREDLVRQVIDLGFPTVIVASDSDLARRTGATGVHLAAGDPWPDREGVRLVGRSCHSPEEVAAAGRAGADYVTLSPVFPTASKPGYGPALGLDGVAAGAAVPGAPPVYGLGGIDATNAGSVVAAGAAGVAVMGAVMAADEPARVVQTILDAIRVQPVVVLRRSGPTPTTTPERLGLRPRPGRS